MKLSILALLCSSVFSQEAQVVVLEAGDVERAASAWAELKKAERAWGQVKQDVAKKYRWGKEFTFSADFKAIVPDLSMTTTSTMTGTFSQPCWGHLQLTSRLAVPDYSNR